MNKWRIVGECSCCQEEMYSYQATTCPDCLAEPEMFHRGRRRLVLL